MSIKKLISFFIILIALFYAAKVYFFKEDIKDLYGNNKVSSTKNYKISNINTFFGKKITL